MKYSFCGTWTAISFASYTLIVNKLVVADLVQKRESEDTKKATWRLLTTTIVIELIKL